MKTYKKNIYKFIISEFGICIVIVIFIFLKHVKVLPRQKFSAKLESYTLNEAVLEFVITFLILNIIYFFLNLFKGENKDDSFKICPGCGEVQFNNSNKEVVCPKCNIKMVPLKGFYDKKQDLKGSNKNENH